jgi:hypothetical protein
LALAIAVTAALAAILVASAGLLAALPALLAFVPLLAGRYVGADTLERLICARGAIDRRAARRPHVARAARRTLLPRGGRLMACSLAKRPPPAAAQLS